MISIQDEPVDTAAILAAVTEPAYGGQALFLGVVRDHDAGRAVTAVTYEAFRPLALKQLEAIAAEAGERFSARVAAVHRLGRLAVGQTSLAVAAASTHREEAFAACRWTVDEIKKRLPVWKKEHFDDGASAWLEGCALDAGKR